MTSAPTGAEPVETAAERTADSPERMGILPIDKPLGWTSHDVVAVVRSVLRIRRVGHGGTLDPLATGLLPVLIGPATKFADRLHTAPKVYAARLRFGHETTTDDREGTPTRIGTPPDLDTASIDAALATFRGAIVQIPPDYAAVKVAGRPAYARARAGETLSLTPRPITIHRLDVAGWDGTLLDLLIVCSTGTYVRSLARDIGRALESAAHLAALRRLAVGALEADEAIGIEALRAAGPDAAFGRIVAADDRTLALATRFRDETAAGLLAGWASP
ncbi:MAG TPA: tRNA pseudouridine(55) synthase TruB [Candidatus Limnocylindria bacterium]